MYAIIVGCGRVGAGLALSLAEDGHDVVVIDTSPEAFRNLGPTFNGLTVVGTGIDRDVLIKAGVERAEALAAVTASDSTNIMASQVAKKIFHVPRVVARINEPGRATIYHEVGISTVCPTDLGAFALRSMLLIKGIQVRYTLGAGEVVIADAVIDREHAGRTVADLEVPGKVRVCAVVRGGVARIPTSDTKCEIGDVLVVSARVDAFDAARSMLEPLTGTLARNRGRNGRA